MKTIEIAGRKIGPGHPCFIIAEAGVNHNGDLDLALRLVDAAAQAGADAVKFQTFKADKLVARGAPQAEYQKKNAASVDQFSMLRSLELTAAEFRKISDKCRTKGVIFLSTPFDENSAELLERLNIPAYKIGSGDFNNYPLLLKIAGFNKPVMLSTGMSDEAEVKRVVTAVKTMGVRDLALLHCTSAYPVPFPEVNLLAIKSLEKFGCPVGFSDHTVGSQAAIAATAIGASIIEKHFTLDRRLHGPDHKASCVPSEFARMIGQIRDVEMAMGDGIKKLMPSESDTRAVARKSIVSSRAIIKGEKVRKNMLTARRPSGGIDPSETDKLIGRTAKAGIRPGTMLKWEMFE